MSNVRSPQPLLAVLILLAACDEAPLRRPGLAGADSSRLSVLDGGGLALVDGGPPGPAPDQHAPSGDLGPGLKPDVKPAPKPDQGVAPPPPPPKPDSGAPPPPPGDYDFLKHITFTTLPSTGGSCSTAQYGDFYCDVLLHTKTPYLGADTLTNIHETQHFMAHDYDGTTAAADKLIYYKGGKGAFYPEPALTTQGITSSIAKQGTTYSTYIASRPTQPLGENIVDEWRAYLTEEIVAIQLAKLKGQSSVSGLVIGGVEFLYYNAAALHALSVKEPGFLSANPQAVAIFAMLAEEVKLWTIDQGLTPGLFAFPQSATAMLAELRTGAGSAPIRATLKSLYGAAWTSRVLGIP
jgi:hypothetical protein